MIISYVLSIGNILNGNTPKGQADGFNLDILSNLSGIKDSSNKNLLQFICAKIKEQEETFDGFKKQFLSLPEAGKTKLADITKDLTKLKKALSDQNDMINKLESLKDDFYNKSKKIYEDNSKQVEILEQSLEINLKNYQSVCLYFGYSMTDPKYQKPEDFFSLISNFIDDVEKFTPKSEPKKNFKAKHDIGKKVIAN